MDVREIQSMPESYKHDVMVKMGRESPGYAACRRAWWEADMRRQRSDKWLRAGGSVIGTRESRFERLIELCRSDI
jgi:hypothetical protein